MTKTRDLADIPNGITDADIASLSSNTVGFLQSGTGAVQRTAQAKLRDVVSVKDFGVVGDGVTDDTSAFIAACTYARSTKRPLDLSDCKIFLATQASSITSDDLTLIGSRAPLLAEVPVNWAAMGGDASQFSVIKAAMITLQGSIIFSTYNGPIFTGKTFSGRDFGVIGDASKASSSAFVQTTPTAYPGWSQAIEKLSDVFLGYFGSHGIRLRGGLEVVTVERLQIHFCGGRCLLVEQTGGVNSPIEYIKIRDSGFSYGLSCNVELLGVAKDILFDNCLLNSPGQLGRLVGTNVITNISSESQIPWPIRLTTADKALITGALNVTIQNCYAEECQGLVKFFLNSSGTSPYPFWKNIRLINNYHININNTWTWFTASFAAKIYDLVTEGNDSPVGSKYYFESAGGIGAEVAGSSNILIGEQDGLNAVTITSSLPQSKFLPKRQYDPTSGTLGTGSAGTYTYNVAADFQATPVNTAAPFALYLITANFQSTNFDELVLT